MAEPVTAAELAEALRTIRVTRSVDVLGVETLLARYDAQQAANSKALSDFAMYKKGTVKYMTKQCEAVSPYIGCASRCVLNDGHPLSHRSLTGTIWDDARGPCPEHLGTDNPCVLQNGHDGVHVGFDGMRWSSPPKQPKHPMRVFCRARHDGDEPCILGHDHIGRHLGANGTYWDGPSPGCAMCGETEALDLAEALRSVLRAVAQIPDQPPMQQNKAFDRGFKVLQKYDAVHAGVGVTITALR
ncbi:MAG TPA: hypothetical protein VIY48_17980 [Candidatus Paceibacterota bacterium]